MDTTMILCDKHSCYDKEPCVSDVTCRNSVFIVTRQDADDDTIDADDGDSVFLYWI